MVTGNKDVLKIDKTVPIPLYFQLKELVRKQIQDGVYKPGETIPTEKELGETYELSRTTVRQAITELTQEGWLYRMKSKGTFVRTPTTAQSFIQALGSFNDQMREMGMRPSTEVLEMTVQKATQEVAENLQIDAGTDVVYLYRRRFADGEPIVLVKTYLPYDRCQFVLDHDFVEESLYPLLATKNSTTIKKIRRLVEAVTAQGYDVRYLGIEPGGAIQQFHSIGYNNLDEPIEFSISRYRGDKNRFEVIVSAT